MQKLITKNADQTKKIGCILGSLLKPKDIICLSGDLGAGKTAFSQGIGEGLNVFDYITSPTYTIINEYNGKIPLYHFDVYRLGSIDEMYELGYEEYFFGDGAIIIEWADMIAPLVPKERLWITIKRTQNEDYREIIFDAVGQRYNEYISYIIDAFGRK